ncbi:MAG: hypothetical protein K8W52_36365 [Deltaproteobacteria bacterium]|nr:hypothetical protein [Deltaproteobacteria bacterium]
MRAVVPLLALAIGLGACHHAPPTAASAPPPEASPVAVDASTIDASPPVDASPPDAAPSPDAAAPVSRVGAVCRRGARFPQEPDGATGPLATCVAPLQCCTPGGMQGQDSVCQTRDWCRNQARVP